MSEMNEYTPELYELEDELGNKRDFEMIDALEIDGQQYFAMTPSNKNQSIESILYGDGNFIIFKTKEVNGEEYLVSIVDDDDEYIKVTEIFQKRVSEKYDAYFYGEENDSE